MALIFRCLQLQLFGKLVWLIYRSQAHHLIEKGRQKKKKENMKHRNCDIHYERFHRRDNIAKYIDLGHASDVSDEQAIEHQGSIFSMHKSDYF